jgi:two-component system, NarL family, response regulator LiaR
MYESYSGLLFNTLHRVLDIVHVRPYNYHNVPIEDRMNLGKIRVLVADDHPVFQEGLCRLLTEEEDIEVVARAASSEDAIAKAVQFKPDVAILDVAMPRSNGIAAAKQMRLDCPETAVLMISAFDNQPYILASIDAGAAGYLLKNTAPRELIAAVRAVNKGEAVFDLKALSSAVNQFRGAHGEKNGSGRLHTRELDVLKLAAKGMSNKEIAKQLVISDRTVQAHMVNIFRKLNVNSRFEAVLHALRDHWFTLDELP